MANVWIVQLSNSDGVLGGTAGIYYDGTTGNAGFIASGSAGLQAETALDIVIGKNGESIESFEGAGGVTSFAFGAKAGLIYGSDGRVIGVNTGLGLGIDASVTYTVTASFSEVAEALFGPGGLLSPDGPFFGSDGPIFGPGGIFGPDGGIPMSFPDFAWFRADPLVIDLNGDGVKLVGTDTSTAYFDYGADGFREKTGWAAGGDGILVRDLDGDGQIENISELLASNTLNVIQTLKLEDTNADNVINASDALWANLNVWVDADNDGVTDAGELNSLSSLGVTVAVHSTDSPPPLF